MSTVRAIDEANIVDVYVLHNVIYPWVLSETSNGNAMGATTNSILDNNIGGVRLERHTVIPCVKIESSYHDIIRLICARTILVKERI